MDQTYLAFFRFFGLRENPFNVNPDPSYLFLNQRTQNALVDLKGAIQARKGLMVLTGDVGTGKTTLVNYLIEWLQRQRTPTAFIFNPRLQVSELFDLMLASFAIPGAHGSALLRLNQWLLERYRGGKNAVLIIDEAQGLPVHVLEEIRMLLNQETPHEKLLQILLCGQPDLETVLNRLELRQMRQRISVRCRMTALSGEETHGYIQKRLGFAGAPPATIFLPEAADAVHRYSRGIPRVMNMLCEHALIEAYLEQTRAVGARIIENVARQLQLDDARPVEKMAAPFMASGSSCETLIEADSAVRVLTLTSQSAAATSISCTTEEALLADIANEAEPVWLSEAIAAQHDGSRQGLRIVSSPSRASNVTEISRDNRKTEAGSARAESGGPKRESGSETQRRRIAPASRARTRGKEYVDLADLREFFGGTLRQASARLQEITEALSRWSSSRWQFSRRSLSRWAGDARDYLASVQWERNVDSLLRWLQEPMSTVKVQRRARH
jgi:type II secretory pathway predicted ATPase ExeA